jgi:hypothetical protein
MAGSVINTFDKGLHQDSSFILQPDGTYRNMKNGMLISYDGNHYTVEMTKGNKILLTLTPRYLNTVLDLDLEPMPIGFVSFIDKLVVFSTNSETTTGYGEIGVISFVRSGMDFIGTYVPYYHHINLNFTKIHKIEGFSFRENTNNQRVYWTDNFNEPRVFDIANPIFTNYIASGSLVVGTQYMVLQGCIIYDSDEYGPTDESGTILSNIFTATTAGGATYGVSDGTPLVIEYYPLSLLDWSPSRLLGNIEFKEYGTGDKYCGSHIYFYRLSNSYDGVVTSWSYASNPIHVGMNNSSTFITGNAYRDFVGNGTATTLENSGKSVKLNITDIDTDFDTIEVACAEFTQVADVPYRIIITNKEAVTGATMSITDTGASNLGTVTISDLTLFPASILKCKTINTNKNYSTIANITEREEFELDLSGVTITQFEYPMISHGDLDSCFNGNIPLDVSPVLGANPAATTIKPWSRYVVSLAPDAANRVEYPVASGTYYYTNDVFVGVVGSTTATFTGTAQARPCTTKNQYTKINSSVFSGNRVDNSIELTTGFWDYKDPAVASHNKGYWSGEKYRFGILFFDLKGNPFYVKYIKGDPTTFDYTFDRAVDKGGLMRNDNYSGADSYSLNPSAIKISGLNIPESVMNQVSGFSIVRAERDVRIITQGLLMQTVIDPTIGANRLMPLGVTRTDLSIYPPFYSTQGDLCTCICPDWLDGNISIAPTSENQIGSIGSKMEEAFWLDGTHFKTYTNEKSFVTKMFDTKANDSFSPRVMTLQSMNGNGIRGFDESNGDVNLIGSNQDFYNKFSTINGTGVDTYVDDTCTSNPNYVGDNPNCIGCKKLMVLPNNFAHYGPIDNYNWGGASVLTNYNKIVVNFLVDKTAAEQYGGVSDAAIANTLYMSCGHFQPINAQVKADTLNGTFASGIYAGENKYTFNDIEVFGGDCFTNLIDLGYGLWDQVFSGLGEGYAYSLWFPCECNSNYNLRRGRKVSNSGLYPDAGAESIIWNTPTRLESYSYNKGYSTDGNFIKYPSLPLNYKFSGNFDYRIRWSRYKNPGELNDSFRIFRIPDYRDVDGQRGQINNLKARDSKLFYWQDHSVGYTPILERQLVGGSALGDATALGVTGVIDRYDDIDTNFGNQHQHGLTETEYGFAWFDMRRRAFMVMGIGSKPEEMSMVKGLQVFFNNEFNEGNVLFPAVTSTIYNTNNLDIPEIPLMGYGIVGVYDPTFKMTYLTFKYTKTDTEPVKKITFVNRDFTLGYNHVLNAFVAFTDNCPAIWHNHNDLVVSANNPKNTKAYNADMPSTSFVIGDTVLVKNVEYICVKDVTIASYPGTTTNGGTSPLALGSTGGANDFWLAINKTNEIYLQNFGADLCKFYGKVWDFEQEVVVNFKTDMAVTPQNMQVKTIGPNSTSVYFDTENQASSDLNISSTNRNYRFIDGAWFFSVALDRLRGRLTDYYVRVKFVHKNYVTNPTTAKNVQKVTQWLKTMFVSKR